MGITSPGSGIIGTGLTVGTTGGGLLGTGLNVGSTSGVLGTGLLVGTTGPGGGLLGTGLRLRAAASGCGTCAGGPGSGGTGSGVSIVTANTSIAGGQTVISERRLSSLSSVAGIDTNNTSGQPAPVATGGEALAVGFGARAAGTAAPARRV